MNCDEMNSSPLPISEDHAQTHVTSVFDNILYKEISPLDVDHIKNVYERVWLAGVLKEQALEKEGDTEKEDASSPIRVKTENSETVCPWNSSEISILREIFKKTKEDNLRLQLDLNITKDEVNRLRHLYEQQVAQFNAQSIELHEAKKANERFHILTSNLQQQLKEAKRKIAVLQEAVTDAKEMENQGLVEMHELRLQSNKEQVDRMQLQIELEQEKSAHQRGEERRQGVMKWHCEQDVARANAISNKLALELKQEKEVHRRCQKGLDHLRKHFSSLPQAGELGEVVPADNIEDNVRLGTERSSARSVNSDHRVTKTELTSVHSKPMKTTCSSVRSEAKLNKSM